MPRTRLWGRGFIFLLVLWSIVAIPRIADATTVSLYSNTALVGQSTSISGAEIAQSFSTGSDPIGLGTVSFDLQNINDNPAMSSGSYTLELFASNAGTPSIFIATLASNVNVVTAGNTTDSYTPSSPVSLAPNSQYFIVLSGSTGNSLLWNFNASAPTTDLSPAPTFGALSSPDGGATWSSLANDYLMTVSGTVLTVPTLSGFADINGTQGQSQTIAPPTSSAPGTFSYLSSNPSLAAIAGDQVVFGNGGSTTITAIFSPADPTTYYSASISDSVTVIGAPPPPPPPPTTTTSTTTTTTTTTIPPTTTSTRPSGPTTTHPPPATTTATTTTTTTAPATSTSTTTTAPTSTTTSPSTTTLPSSSTSSSPPTTTTSPVNTSPAASPTAVLPNSSLFSSTEGSQLVAQIDATTSDPVSGTQVSVNALTADPNTSITVEVHSTPQIILNSVTSAKGTFKGSATIPSSLEPGVHLLIIRAIYQGLPVTLVGGFVKTSAGTFATIVQPTVITNFAGINDPRLTRALRFGLPVYDVKSHAATTVGLVVAGGSLLALAGAGGVVGSSLGVYERRQTSHAHSKVASAVTKKLKAVGTKHDSWGDRSLTWRHPLTSRVDTIFRDLPAKVGPYSALVPRVLTDGSWFRAIFGAWSLVLGLAGLGLGVLSLFFHSAAPFVPSVLLIFLLIGLGVLDAAASLVAWLVIAVVSLSAGSVQSWADLRTVLGLGVLVVTVPFLAHAIRPLRRYLFGDVSERWERLFDYVMMPVFVAFASASMAKALDGLSGLTILSPQNLSAIRWFVAVMIIVRLLGEDAALHFYPERSKAVQPAKLVAPRVHFGAGALVFKFSLYLLVMDPYFGLTYKTVIAAALLAIPGVLKLREDSLPNSKLLHRWLPRGLTSFLFMLLLGSFMSFHLLGLDPTSSTLDSTFLWLLLPGVVIGVIELFGREGEDWHSLWLKRLLGALVWLTAAGLVTGDLVLFR